MGSRWRDFNRMKGRAYRSASRSYALSVLGGGSTSAALLALDEKLQQKIIQNAIKPITRLAVKEWRGAIKQARTSGRYKRHRFRRTYGAGLRASLARSIKSVLPSGTGKKSLRGYAIMRDTVKKNRGKSVVTQSAQMYWLEYGTRPHTLGGGSSLRRGVQGGRGHPGTQPITDVRSRMRRLAPTARRMFADAIRSGIRSGGETIKAPESKRLLVIARAA